MRKFKIKRVIETVFTMDTTGVSKTKSALNVVWLDCGHVAEVSYWPIRHHYRPGDKCRCYDCPKNAPKTTPDDWRRQWFEEWQEAE